MALVLPYVTRFRRISKEFQKRIEGVGQCILWQYAILTLQEDLKGELKGMIFLGWVRFSKGDWGVLV